MPNLKYRILKIVILGDGGVGKTSIRMQYFEKGFKSHYLMTMGADFGIKRLKSNDGDNMVLQIWDLAGNQTFSRIRQNYYKGAHGALVVFDLTNKQSFDNLKKWMEEMKEFSGKMLPFILCGNKVDLIGQSENIVPDSDIQEFIMNIQNNHNIIIPYIQTSAKTGQSVDEAFKAIIDEITNSSIKNT